ncbi:MAG: class I SAM-dependent rRNA methyltransferase [Candidatus Omnitrophota bacterium]
MALTVGREAVTLKKGKEKAIKNRHHWIFSGAIQFMPDFEDGRILPVRSCDNEFLGLAYFNRKSSITGRMICFENVSPEDAVQAAVKRARELRSKLFDNGTNAYRLINGEGDGMPGLIVDVYGSVLVLQIATMGMDKLKPAVLDALIKEFSPEGILEKSRLQSRKEEGLEGFEGVIYGNVPESITIKENHLPFIVRPMHAQKTGFFLDQRGSRQMVRRFAEGKRVLNCFSYTGAFSVYALKGGASRVDSIDESEDAIGLAMENVRMNGYDTHFNRFFVADVFEFLRSARAEYDFVILDPPAFAKRKTDIVNACRGYKDINRLAISKLSGAGFVLTSSCSYHVDEGLFQKVVFQASREAGRNVRIIQRHALACDHPVNIYHPEGEYLKSLLLYVD